MEREFRIVISYEKDELVWLGAVNNIDYEVDTIEVNSRIFRDLVGIRSAEVNSFSWEELLDRQENAKPYTEGFVVKTESGFVKVKHGKIDH